MKWNPFCYCLQIPTRRSTNRPVPAFSSPASLASGPPSLIASNTPPPRGSPPSLTAVPPNHIVSTERPVSSSSLAAVSSNRTANGPPFRNSSGSIASVPSNDSASVEAPGPSSLAPRLPDRTPGIQRPSSSSSWRASVLGADRATAPPRPGSSCSSDAASTVRSACTGGLDSGRSSIDSELANWGYYVPAPAHSSNTAPPGTAARTFAGRVAVDDADIGLCLSPYFRK